MKKRRPFAVFDIDGTLIRWQLYHAISDHLVKLGFIRPEGYQAIKDARLAWKKRQKGAGFKRYEQKLVAGYAKSLKTITPQQFEQAVESVFDEYKDQSYTYTRDLIAELKKRNYALFAISGSQTEIIKKIAEYWQFDGFRASTYTVSDGKYTGESVHYLGRKAEALDELVREHGLGYADSIAVGDSLSDSPLLEAVEQPIAFNPERELYDLARQKGWTIVIERKNVVYRLEEQNGRYELV